ncbi:MULTISPECIES: ABC transporter permease [Thiomicrorhabdus]|uniref:ABC transporter permease n=1 Tax=Thiomicrorhabdus heinhorstiae TaxID=2748010 RepID=A0ABS0BST8_9GAMM|nr:MULTISPECIES: ABC transporter permease [Thiomicrorhabdus]MBF6056917.1 ABC transporter permease [Thiomicrorhabdus heinhorstiae]
MSLVFLWTDLLIWILFGAVVFGLHSIKKSKQARKQWREIFESPIAMASAVILSVYVLIGLTDSIHLKFNQENRWAPAGYENQVLSPLDLSLWHLVKNQERTYSAPFASHEYSRSILYDENGQVQQVYRPLKFAAVHLENPDNRQVLWQDLIKKSGIALLAAFLLTLVVFVFHGYFRVRAYVKRDIRVKPKRLPWNWGYLTLFLLLAVMSILYYLSHFYHVLGTDKVGEDVFYQAMKSIRTGVVIGTLTTLVMLPLALFLGISAGYFKGWIDDVIQYLYTTLNSIPGVLLIAAAVLVMQSWIAQHPADFGSSEQRADLRLLFLVFILGMTSWTGLCRLLRAETLKISQLEYIQSAKAFGMGGMHLIYKHILPNLLHLVLIAVVLDFSGLVLAEAVLSYVGVGVDPTTYSWGNMINQARLEMAREPMVWWSLLSAFIFMFILVLAANLFADRVQWVLNPRNS